MRLISYLLSTLTFTLLLASCSGGNSDSEMAAHLKKFAAGEASLYPGGVFGEIIQPFVTNTSPYPTVVAVDGEFPLVLHGSFNGDILRDDNYKNYILHALPLDEAGSAEEFCFFYNKTYNEAIETYKNTPRVPRGETDRKKVRGKLVFSSKVIEYLAINPYYYDNPKMLLFLESGDVIIVKGYTEIKGGWSNLKGKTVDVNVDPETMTTHGIIVDVRK